MSGWVVFGCLQGHPSPLPLLSPQPRVGKRVAVGRAEHPAQSTVWGGWLHSVPNPCPWGVAAGAQQLRAEPTEGSLLRVAGFCSHEQPLALGRSCSTRAGGSCPPAGVLPVL